MSYNPEIKVFYGGLDPEFRLIPSPSINLSVQSQYANDTIIGYTYTITLTGSITALDLRDGEESVDSNYGIGAVIDHVYKLRKILAQNGNILYIIKSADDSHILKAKGGILKSFDIQESPNNWIHYANYTATLEFSSVDFMSYTEDCGSVFIDSTSFSNGSAGVVDLNKFKIKSFDDSWSITFDETESYNKIKEIENNNYININNSSFNIEYTINAVGKHFFTYTNNEDPGQLLPAWEHAKNFVQYRLYYQVTNLINGVLKNTYSNSCSSQDGLNEILIPGQPSGLFSSLNDSNYIVYNEEISCETSESDGSFSATYKGIIKNKLSNNTWTNHNAKHKITKKKSKNTDTKGATITTISINGTIEGLIEGGLIRMPGPIQLPNTGSFLIKGNNNINEKYNNAKSLLDKIYNPFNYNNGIGNSGKRDLNYSFKEQLGITLEALNAIQAPDDEILDPPHPVSFNLTHDYNNGNINYSLEYSNVSCSRKYSDISIQINNPNKIIATFNIPNSNNCPTIQELGTTTAKTISITIQGLDLSEIGRPTSIVLDNLIDCTSCDDIGYFPIDLPINNYILTEKKYSSNPVDGSFTINLGYTCDVGCDI